MSEMTHSHIADLRFAETPFCDFSRLISELDALLARLCGDLRRLSWDCDDVAIFDMPGTRILLAFTETDETFHAARLVVSVGPSPVPHLRNLPLPDHAAMCHRIVDRLSDRCHPDELHWDKQSGVMTSDIIDEMLEPSEPHAPRRPDIFAPFAMGPAGQAAELYHLRAALHPYGQNADFPAAVADLARQSMALAISMAHLPVTALHFAATYLRATQKQA